MQSLIPSATHVTPGKAHSVRVRVWDPLVRVFHWGLAAGFAVAYLVEDDWLALHVWTGYIMLGLVAFRLLWGIRGPQHARWSDFVKAPAEIIAYLKAAIRADAARHLGHNPAGGAMVVALVACVAATAFSGLAVYGGQELSGPLATVLAAMPAAWAHVLEDVHEVLANLTLLLVFLHVAGVVWASLQHRENLIMAMITGYKWSKPQ
jgi:cytochrome b